MAILGLDTNPFQAGLNRAQQGAATAGRQIGSALGGFIEGKLAAFASITGIEQEIQRTIHWGEETVKLSRQLGISTEAVQLWDYALRQNGTSLESNAKFFTMLAVTRKKALGGNEEIIASFKRLGVTMEELKTKRLEEVGLTIAQAFRAGDPQALLADLREVAGRGAGELVAAFRSGFAELMSDAKQAGIVVEDEVIQRLKRSGDQMRTLWLEFRPGLAWIVSWATAILLPLRRGLDLLGELYLGTFVEGPRHAINNIRNLIDIWRDADRASRAREKAAGITPLAADLETPDTKKAAADRKREEERSIELLDRLEDVQKKNQLAALTREGQVNELYRRRAQLARWIADNAGRLADTARLQAEIDLETMKGEEERLQRELDKPAREHHPNLPDVNALQRIGAWAAAPGFEAMALSVHKQNEKHLAAMKTDLHTLAHGAGGFHQVHF